MPGEISQADASIRSDSFTVGADRAQAVLIPTDSVVIECPQGNLFARICSTQIGMGHGHLWAGVVNEAGVGCRVPDAGITGLAGESVATATDARPSAVKTKRKSFLMCIGKQRALPAGRPCRSFKAPAAGKEGD